MADLLIRMQHTPYGGSKATDGLDFAIAATNYGHQVKLIFEGDGVYQLLKEQAPPTGIKNHLKRLKSLVFYDIEELYVCKPSLQSRNLGLEDLGVEAQVIASQSLLELVSQADHVVTF
ncbi:sulfurtransferase complex subunit TusC [Alteromonas aestuariivivens]|uniref:Sulfurtransferase complex subunit TusC n=1 Tax=Alteromonas aestuariivivens TaxID=1938339 RepID=A0A3D8M316_9ALTE|nr:sulfurtransferase complex subunit TusC [Alteromonas aestuariivivens]RDV23924.1 sulfurtransferase complex subunit TusC [Alteromonas aestuariivivens]